MLVGIWQQDCCALRMPRPETLRSYPRERSDRGLWLAVGIALDVHATAQVPIRFRRAGVQMADAALPASENECRAMKPDFNVDRPFPVSFLIKKGKTCLYHDFY
jgi:hypothetical protein